MISQFSVSIKCRLGSRIVTEVADANKVLVIAAKAAGKDRMSDLIRRDDMAKVVIAGESFSSSRVAFEFQKVWYNYLEEKDTFVRQQYPSAAPVSSFYSSTGYKSEGDVEVALRRWGPNDFDIPLPDFLDIYMVCVW